MGSGARGDLSDEFDALRDGGSPGNFLWIGLKNPTQAEFDEVNEELQLHPLAVEDAIHGRQRAKVELYENSVFVVLKPLRYVEQTSDIETGELMCFVGDHFIVTVRRGEASPLAGLRHRLEARAGRAAARPDRRAARHRRRRRRQLHGHRRRGVRRPRRHRDRRVLRRRHGLLDDLPPQARGARVPPGDGATGGPPDGGCTRTRARTSPTPSCGCSSATCPTTSRRSSTTWSRTTGCSPTCSAPTSPRSRCSRTPTCAASRPGSPSRPSPR